MNSLTLSSQGRASGGTPFAPWGKLQREGDVVTGLHPLCDHLIDVAACFKAIAQCMAIGRALRAAAGREITPIDLERLCVLALLHDVGKANAGFQAKYWAAGVAPVGWPLPCGHGEEGWALLSPDCQWPSLRRIAMRLPLAALESWGEITVDLLHASLSHHGRPVTGIMNASTHIWQPVTGVHGPSYDPAATLGEISALVQRLYPLAFEADPASLPQRSAFVHLFAGLVQLADWLASDTRFFRYSLPGEDRTRG